MFGNVIGHEPRARSVKHRAGGDHLGINARTARQQAVEESAVPVRPFHHWGDAELAIRIVRTHAFFRSLQQLNSVCASASRGLSSFYDHTDANWKLDVQALARHADHSCRHCAAELAGNGEKEE